MVQYQHQMHSLTDMNKAVWVMRGMPETRSGGKRKRRERDDQLVASRG